MDTFNIRPVYAGLVILDPDTGNALADAGEVKPRNSFWLRRLNEGDVIIIAETVAPVMPVLKTKQEATA